MSGVGQRKVHTQQRVIVFIRDAFGYDYLGHWKGRDGNSNIEAEQLTDWLRRQEYDSRLINRTPPSHANNAVPIDASRALCGLGEESFGD